MAKAAKRKNPANRDKAGHAVCYQVWSIKRSKWIGAEHRPNCNYSAVAKAQEDRHG